jgi:NAD(P)-dependent dehydrogenase (short-subunit alcohol dehydrogenase family)
MTNGLRVAVTGASRGLGLEFVRQLIDRGDRVCAMARDPGGGLTALLSRHQGDSLAIKCDVTDEASVLAAAQELRSRWNTLDVLINNAGVAGGREASLANLDWQDVRATFETNTLGPLRATRAFLPLLRAGRSPKAVHITSTLGSIARNEDGGWWAYRMSKAALNMACKNMAIELRRAGIATFVLHPGWVRTDMGGSAAPLSAAESVRGMLRVIDDLTLEDTGSFRDHTGDTLPW